MSASYNILTRFILLILFVSLLLGCMTTYHGDGIVMSEQKIKGITPEQSRMKQGARLVGTVSAGAGIGAGAIVGLFIGAFSGPGAAALIVPATVGAIAGGVTFGLVGAAIGGSIGYVGDKINSNAATYEYTVKSLHDSKLFTVKQYSIPVPVNTRVKILERSGVLFIKKHP